MEELLSRFNIHHRGSIMKEMSGQQQDLLIIGGGITGASIFRDAAHRGLRVALLEANDFASGTSSRSSKLIHGGLRYIKQLGFRLAWESCHERNLHVRLNKRLVKPVPFLLPLYEGKKPSRASTRIEMLLFEALDGFRNYRFHRFLSREETLLLAPGIPTQGLTGAVTYYDAMVNDSRWTIEVTKDGVRHGGLALNHARVTNFAKHRARIVEVSAVDSISNQEFTVRAHVIINATGVCGDRLRSMDSDGCTPLLKMSRGTHLVFCAEDLPLGISTIFASSIDGRSLFLVQRDGSFLLGTTDDWSDDEPDHPAPAVGDIKYLTQSLESFMPECAPIGDKIRFVYSGFRPLLSPGVHAVKPSDAARDDLIEVSPSGLVSVIGGKLTTARVMAKRVLQRVIPLMPQGRRFRTCRTASTSIGGDNEQVAEAYAFWVKKCPEQSGYFRVLFDRYGVEARHICSHATEIHAGRDPDPLAEPIRAEVQYVCRHEMVCSVEDLIERRAGFLHWDVRTRLERARHGARVISRELGITDAEFENQMEKYRNFLSTFHRVPECPYIATSS